MQLTKIRRVNRNKESLTALITVKHGNDQVTESATAKWSSTEEGFKVVSSGVSAIIDDEDSISVVFDMSDLGLKKTLNLKLDESVNLSSSTSATDENDEVVVESGTSTDTKDAFFLTNVDGEPLDTLSGGYYGSDFVFSTAVADSEQEALVGGTVDINGVGPVEATYSFKSVRYAEGNLYEENLQILTSLGCLVANAIYVDYGVGFISTAERADFLVHTSYGELRETKGMVIRITFNNNEPGLPRTITLVPAFGGSQVNAKLLSTESHLETEEATTTTYEFDFSIADSDDINVTWYDADTTQDPVTSSLATLKTDNGTLGSAIFAAALDDDHGNTAFISSETNFIVDVPGSQTAGTSAITGILEAEEDGDNNPRVVKDSVKGTIRETIMATVNDVTYTFNRTLAIANFQLTYDPARDDDYYPNIVYQTPRGDKLTVSIKTANMRKYTFELTE
jgi:hypothetical protein